MQTQPKHFTDFPERTTRYALAFHFARLWKIRESDVAKDSLKQNIKAQRRLKDESHRNYQ